MNQRVMILNALHERARTRAAIARGTDGRATSGADTTAAREQATAFRRLLAERSDLHWQELVKEFREHHYDAVWEIVPALLATDDALIVYNCVRFADLGQQDELEIFKDFARDCDVVKHQVSLLTLLEGAEAEFAPLLRERGTGRPREDWEAELDTDVAATLFQLD